MIRAAASTGSGRIRPYAATTSRSGLSARSSARNSAVRIFAGLSSGSPRRSATAPTSLGSSLSPRPRGWSGRVTTPAISKPGLAKAERAASPQAPASRSRICAASAGVPMKTILSGVAISDPDAGGPLAIGLALLYQLGEFTPVKFALDAADAIDEELAVEMVDLMLQRHREQVICLDLDFLFLGRPRAHQHPRGAFYVGGVVDHREASFLPYHRTVGFDDRRIDKPQQCLAGVLMVGVEHHHAARIADLGRRQSHARRRVHRLHHALDKAREAAVDFGDRLCRILERGVGKFADVEERHRQSFFRG